MINVWSQPQLSKGTLKENAKEDATTMAAPGGIGSNHGDWGVCVCTSQFLCLCHLLLFSSETGNHLIRLLLIKQLLLVEPDMVAQSERDFVCLLFYILATYKVRSGLVLTFDSAHSW